MLDSASWTTAIATGALAIGTFVLAWVTVSTATKDRRHDDEKRAEDRARDDRLRQESLEQLERAQFERAIMDALSAAADLSSALRDSGTYKSMRAITNAAKDAEDFFTPPSWWLDENFPSHMKVLRRLIRIIDRYYGEKPADLSRLWPPLNKTGNPFY